jgi:hypothetical protein
MEGVTVPSAIALPSGPITCIPTGAVAWGVTTTAAVHVWENPAVLLSASGCVEGIQSGVTVPSYLEATLLV